jgi:hypothetical protein
MKELRKAEKKKKQRREKYENGPGETFRPRAETSPRPTRVKTRTGTQLPSLPRCHVGPTGQVLLPQTVSSAGVEPAVKFSPN